MGVLFLLPSINLGCGATVVDAFGQLDLSIPDGGQEEDGEEGVQATSPSMTSTFLLRGIMPPVCLHRVETPQMRIVVVAIFWLGDGEYL